MLDSGLRDPVSLAGALREISSQARRASAIIQRLREFVVESTPNTTAANLQPLVREVVELLANDVRHQHVHLRLDFASPLPPVLADAIQIQQVILNLMRNAIESMEQLDGPRRVLHVTIEPMPDRPMIQVSVADSGAGCPEPTLTRMFDAFYTTKKGGMGMGLSISRTLIEAHGGRIWATHNESRRGITVHFTLPTATGVEHEQPDPFTPQPQHG